MRSDGVAQFEYGVHNRVASRVESNRAVCVTHIVVDSAGDADDVEFCAFVDCLNAAERAVTADDDKVFYSAFEQVLNRCAHDVVFLKFGASGRAQNRAACMHAVGHA